MSGPETEEEPAALRGGEMAEVQLRRIEKVFGAVRVIKGVDLEI